MRDQEMLPFRLHAACRRPARVSAATYSLIVLLAGFVLTLRAATVSVGADADTFVRSLAPSSNYGIGGALSISGSNAVNGAGQQMGLLDSLMRFPMADTAAAFDTSLGEDWLITGVRLLVTEMATPDDAIFNRGVGAFEIRWMPSNSWAEGTGKPISPTTDGAAWQDLPLLLNSNVDQSVGVFTNSGMDGPLAFSLGLPDRFLAGIHAGAEVSFYLTSADPDVGFTFNSRNFGNTNAQPALEITAQPNPRPQIDSIGLSGTNVVLNFSVNSNWTYVLQFGTNLESGPGAWSNLFTVPPQPTATNVTYVDTPIDRLRFYRLSVGP
jgi:hypothetical protein